MSWESDPQGGLKKRLALLHRFVSEGRWRKHDLYRLGALLQLVEREMLAIQDRRAPDPGTVALAMELQDAELAAAILEATAGPPMIEPSTDLWTMRDGTIIPVSEMELSHLVSTVEMLRRNARGTLIQMGYPPADVYRIYPKFPVLQAELNRRVAAEHEKNGTDPTAPPAWVDFEDPPVEPEPPEPSDDEKARAASIARRPLEMD